MTKIRKTRSTTFTSLLKVRVTQDQHDLLMQTAHKKNMTFSTYARKVLLTGIEDTHV